MITNETRVREAIEPVYLVYTRFCMVLHTQMKARAQTQLLFDRSMGILMLGVRVQWKTLYRSTHAPNTNIWRPGGVLRLKGTVCLFPFTLSWIGIGLQVARAGRMPSPRMGSGEGNGTSQGDASMLRGGDRAGLKAMSCCASSLKLRTPTVRAAAALCPSPASADQSKCTCVATETAARGWKRRRKSYV